VDRENFRGLGRRTTPSQKEEMEVGEARETGAIKGGKIRELRKYESGRNAMKEKNLKKENPSWARG